MKKNPQPPRLVVLAICTCGRNDMLCNTLRSIEAGSGPPSGIPLEIVVVDNDSSGSARATVEAFSSVSRFPVHYACEPRPGIPFARNCAIDMALRLSADAMIFVDDDELVRQDWLEKLVARYLERNKEGIDVIQGPVFPKFLEPPHKDLPVELFCTPGVGRKMGERLRTAATNNVIFNMRLCTDAGLRFEEKMQFIGSSDTVFFRDATEVGYLIEWYPDAVAEEVIPPSRMTMAWLRMRYFRYGCSNVYGHLLRHGRRRTWRQHRKSMLEALGKSFDQLSLSNPAKLNRAIVFGCQALGILSGLLGYRYREYMKRVSKISNAKYPPAPKVSIIIPIFNDAKFIGECLDSVVTQTLREIEIICVDDCSTDDSYHVLDRFARLDPRIVILRQERNSGISAARNRGIRASRGQHLMFVDSDDKLACRDAVEHLYKAAIRYNAQVVMGNTIQWHPDAARQTKYYATRHLDKDFKRMRLIDQPGMASYVVVWNKLFKRSFLVKSHLLFFNEDIPRFEDNCYTWKIMALAKNICFSKKASYLFRQPTEGYFEKKMLPNLEHQGAAFEEMFQFFDTHPEVPTKTRSIIEGRYANVFLQLLRQPDMLKQVDPERCEKLMKMYFDVFGRMPKKSFRQLPMLARRLYKKYKAGGQGAAIRLLYDREVAPDYENKSLPTRV